MNDHYFATHFGTYEVIDDDRGLRLAPLADDPAPARFGLDYLELSQHSSRVGRPMVRRGWLDNDAASRRGHDEFVAVSWPRATRLVAAEIRRVVREHGNRAIYAGSQEPIHDAHGTVLRPKIVSAKARGADRSHSAVKLRNAGWRDFGPQPEGPVAIFPQSGVAARLCSWATPRSLRLVLRKNSRRRGVVRIMNRL